MKHAARKPAKVRFVLYVADHALNSTQAIANLGALCREHLPGRHEIRIVDVFEEPKRALADSVFMTPTLIMLGASPACKVIGTLADTEAVMHALRLGTSALAA